MKPFKTKTQLNLKVNLNALSNKEQKLKDEELRQKVQVAVADERGVITGNRLKRRSAFLSLSTM